MARNVTLEQLVDDLRAEVGRDSSVAAGKNELPGFKKRLARMQNQLYQKFDWPFMRTEQTIALQAGERYYDWPTLLNPDRVEKVEVRWNTSWYPVLRGIGPNEYNSYDSVDDERSDPVLRWDVRSTGASLAAQVEQIELWPIPASNDPVLHMWGMRPLRALVAEADRCDIDSDLIVLTLAAKILARGKSADAPLVKKEADDLWRRLTGNSRGADESISMIGTGGRPQKVVGTIIRIA
jgi:hypothetical protein